MTELNNSKEKYNLRHINIAHCGNCKYYNTGDAPNADMVCVNDLMRNNNGGAVVPNRDDVCDLYERRTEKQEIVIGLNRDQFNRLDAAMKEYLMRGYDL